MKKILIVVILLIIAAPIIFALQFYPSAQPITSCDPIGNARPPSL